MNSSTVQRARLASLDVLRGSNIAAMIVFHYLLLYYPEPVDAITGAIHWVGGQLAELFFYLAGAGVWFFLRRGAPSTLLKRGIFLFLVATLVGLFRKGYWFIEWTVIQDIGFAFVLMALLAHFTTRRFSVGLGLYILFGVLARWFNYGGVGFFPFFPNVIYFLIGYGYAALCPIRRNETSSIKSVALAVIVPMALIALGLAASGWRLFPGMDWYSEALLSIGMFALIYFWFLWVWGSLEFKNPFGEYLIQIGRLSLTIYYVQQSLLRFLQAISFHVVLVHPFLSYLVLMVSVLIGVFILLKLWRPFNYAWSLEWIMRKI
ncbi:MAG: acyltransferase family protein [Chloroflexi bacterium]|nr:acyltransferase family protein [Chloroflexota bacterium]